MTQEQLIQLLSDKNENEGYVLQPNPLECLAGIGLALIKGANTPFRDYVRSILNEIDNPKGLMVFTKYVFENIFVRIVYPRETNELVGLVEKSAITPEEGESLEYTPILHYFSYIQ